MKCVVHASQGECVLDGACGWCVDKEICIEKQALATRSLCDPVPGNLLTGQVAHRKKQPDRVLLKYNGTLVGMGKSRTKCRCPFACMRAYCACYNAYNMGLLFQTFYARWHVQLLRSSQRGVVKNACNWSPAAPHSILLWHRHDSRYRRMLPLRRH